MNRLFTPCLMILLMAASCQKSSVSPTSVRKPLSSSTFQAVSNGATTFNSQLDIDLAKSGFIEISTCNGDILQITGGTFHIVSHQTISNNDLFVNQHTNTQELKMVSTTTGAEY